MSLHKLTAGSGYDYLTRQVAALDATDKGHIGLASYYSERGESPGVWVGSGMEGIDGLDVGDPVTAEQMRALFGCGLHPLAELRLQQWEGPDLTGQDFRDVMRLGAPFKIMDDATPFRVEVAKRIAALNAAIGEPVDASVAAADRARIRTQVAREFFVAEHGRAPIDARELAGQIAKSSRPRAQTVAGFDLTFSPVKSVSTLWAVAEPAVAAAIERAHQAAVKDALSFIEQQALFTRTGPQGIRQVNVRGLVAAAFTHRDSRAGDPDLHTHVAVANKVQTLDGRWLSIDGRVLFKAKVAASETYNTVPGAAPPRRARGAVRCASWCRSEQAADPGNRRRRPSTEPALVDPPRPHQHPPRRARHPVPSRSWPTADPGRSAAPGPAGDLGDPRRQTRTPVPGRATRHLAERSGSSAGRTRRRRGDGADGAHPAAETATIADARWVAQTADHVLAVMEECRSTWQMWHVRAEVQRQIRTADVPVERASVLVDLLVDEVLDRRSVALVAPPDGIEEPEALRRTTDPRSTPWPAPTSTPRSGSSTPSSVSSPRPAAATAQSSTESAVDLALLEMAANRTALDAGQASLVRQMCTSGARLQLAIAPAGAGKTTAMRALTLAWTQDGGQVLGLAPSAAAAAVLGEQTGIRTDTLAKLTWSLDHGDLPDWAAAVGPSTLVIIDEAGMADTLTLDAAVQFAIDRGASVRLIGDDQQLAAIGAGGVLRDINNIPTAPYSSPSCTGSPTRPKHKPRSPCGKAIPAHSASISIMAVSMSVISPRSPRMRSLLGFPTEPSDSTRSCSPPPASSSLSSTAEPVIIVSTVPRQGKKCVWGTETGRVSET